MKSAGQMVQPRRETEWERKNSGGRTQRCFFARGHSRGITLHARSIPHPPPSWPFRTRRDAMQWLPWSAG